MAQPASFYFELENFSGCGWRLPGQAECLVNDGVDVAVEFVVLAVHTDVGDAGYVDGLHPDGGAFTADGAIEYLQYQVGPGENVHDSFGDEQVAGDCCQAFLVHGSANQHDFMQRLCPLRAQRQGVDYDLAPQAVADEGYEWCVSGSEPFVEGGHSLGGELGSFLNFPPEILGLGGDRGTCPTEEFRSVFGAGD